MKGTIIIVGASISGLHAASALVKNGYPGNIILIDRKETPPYNTYPLSKDWIRGEDDLPPFLKNDDFYKSLDLRLNTNVKEFDPHNKTVTLDNGEVLNYDKLLIATGSKLRRLNLEHGDGEGIFYLRSYKEALAIKHYAKHAHNIVLIGGGFISLELAASLSQMGKQVTILERTSYPLGKILGQNISQYFMKMHKDHGVKIVTSVEITSLNVDDHNQIKSVSTNLNETFKCDMLVIGVGVVPNPSISHPDLEVLKGTIVVNAYNETSIKDVYAAGDVVSWPYGGSLIHIEHWENAYNQGISAAKNMMNERSSVFSMTPYFWTDQYDQTFEYLGHASQWYRSVIRGSLESRNFTVAYLDENDTVLAVLFANKFDKRKEVLAYLTSGVRFDETRFQDVSLRLNEII